MKSKTSAAGRRTNVRAEKRRIVSSVSVTDSVSAPLQPPRERLRDHFFATARRWSLGLVGGRRRRLTFGPITLLRFGQPVADQAGWSWPVEGGLLAAGPGGRLRIAWSGGELT